MPERDTNAGHSARLLRGLVWAGVVLAPIAAAVVLIGSTGFAVVLVAVSVVLIGASVLIRADPVLLRMDVEDRVAEEVASLRRELRAEFAAATPEPEAPRPPLPVRNPGRAQVGPPPMQQQFPDQGFPDQGFQDQGFQEDFQQEFAPQQEFGQQQEFGPQEFVPQPSNTKFVTQPAPPQQAPAPAVYGAQAQAYDEADGYGYEDPNYGYDEQNNGYDEGYPDESYQDDGYQQAPPPAQPHGAQPQGGRASVPGPGMPPPPVPVQTAPPARSGIPVQGPVRA
ncbi:MAG TPA: hypothetical protein VN408_07130, partial [Actinoplanes sp.]|nr:hypothetical protein [Actinoplanes sp.]